MNKTKKSTIVVSFLGLYLISTGISWLLFSFIKSDPRISSFSLGNLIGGNEDKDLSGLPLTEECPINGDFFTVPERESWETRRPITAIIENHADSRPLEGLHRADIVYEAVAEGGVTRQLGIFYCGVSGENVRLAPVRSARVYFINWAAEYGSNPIFTHVGGANRICDGCAGGVKPRSEVALEVDAVGLLSELGWRVPRGNDFDATYDVAFPVFTRDPERLGRQIATEHTMVAFTDNIYEEAERRGFAYSDESGTAWNDSFRSWKFVDENPSNSPTATSISFEFWSNQPDYNVEWKYDKETNTYMRYVGGVQAVDNNSGEPFTAKNVVIQFLLENGPVDNEKHMFYKTVGTGDALIFQNGSVIEARWEKDDIFDRTLFSDTSGSEIEFVRGQTWIEGVPEGNEINY